MVPRKNPNKSDFRRGRVYSRPVRTAFAICILGLGAACSINDDLGTTLAVPANYPKFSDMPDPVDTSLSPAEVTALRMELNDLAATHDADRTEQIVER
jgi:hypothetical protein